MQHDLKCSCLHFLFLPSVLCLLSFVFMHCMTALGSCHQRLSSLSLSCLLQHSTWQSTLVDSIAVHDHFPCQPLRRYITPCAANLKGFSSTIYLEEP